MTDSDVSKKERTLWNTHENLNSECVEIFSHARSSVIMEDEIILS